MSEFETESSAESIPQDPEQFEIERKFLIDNSLLPDLTQFPKSHIEQFYLTEGKTAVRVRKRDDKYFLTIKGPKTKGKGIEYEKPITEEEYISLKSLAVAGISKYRYLIEVDGNEWELDEFLGPLESFWLAEIELSDVDQQFTKPEWVSLEVTDDPKWANQNMAFWST